MYPFIESIRVEDGVPQNIAYHNDRLNATRASFWPGSSIIDLKDHIQPCAGRGNWKCRVLYDREIMEVTYTPYTCRPVRSLKAVYCNDLEYVYKSSDRRSIDHLFSMREAADDILIVKGRLLTDTSIANVALFDGNDWYTPLQPLLKGTRRAFLLDSGVIKERNIQVGELGNYFSITLFNAMIGFREIEIPVDKIIV